MCRFQSLEDTFLKQASHAMSHSGDHDNRRREVSHFLSADFSFSPSPQPRREKAEGTVDPRLRNRAKTYCGRQYRVRFVPRVDAARHK